MTRIPVRLLALFALLLAGCAPFDGDGGDAFRPSDDGVDAPDVDPVDGSDLGDDDDDDGGNEHRPADDDDDDDEGGGGDDAWDASPPEGLADGSELHIDLSCGLLDGLHRKVFEKDGDEWLEVDGEGAGPIAELRACFVGSDEKFLTWDDTPEMYIFAGGLHHDITPTSVEDRWMGLVYPEEDSSRECLEALADANLEWPIRMTLTVTNVIPAP